MACVEELHQVSSEYAAEFSIQAARRSLLVPELPEVWDFLVDHPKLGDVAEIYRGIEWNIPLVEDGTETGNRPQLVKSHPSEGYKLGIAPRTNFNVLEPPPAAYRIFMWRCRRSFLASRMGEAKSDYAQNYALTRALENSGDSRQHRSCVLSNLLRHLAKSDAWDEWSLSAVLNSPVANVTCCHQGRQNRYNEGNTDTCSHSGFHRGSAYQASGTYQGIPETHVCDFAGEC